MQGSIGQLFMVMPTPGSMPVLVVQRAAIRSRFHHRIPVHHPTPTHPTTTNTLSSPARRSWLRTVQ